MSTPDDHASPEPDSFRGRPAGDEEREHRERIAKTGEPKRDALGNADGAS